ncbi:MAG: sugar phosphate nucleotidyltransferase [Thermoanaerobaculum sp.]|nr:sugar phosphate nucleotidyltransferase [Thermoanaerobaculum sp.]
MSWCSVKAVVLAGGSGTRFWPLSRAHRPKQLLPLWGGKTLLGATLERILPLVGWEGVLVVTGQHLAPAVAEHLPKLPPQQLLREPCGRDTAAAVGWAAWREVSQGGNPVLVVLPADHWVGDDEAFRQVVRAGVALAQGTNGLVTVALSPTRPETGYGYLELGEVVEARELSLIHI